MQRCALQPAGVFHYCVSGQLGGGASEQCSHPGQLQLYSERGGISSWILIVVCCLPAAPVWWVVVCAMTAAVTSQDVLYSALCSARDELRNILEVARGKFEELGSKFAEKGIFVLVGGIAIYAELYKRTNPDDSKNLEFAITKGHRMVKTAASELLDIEDEWNSFLGEVEGKERDTGALVAIGDVIPRSIILHHVTLPSHSATACNDGALNAETLEDILRSSCQNAVLFVLSRHFA